MRLISIFSGIIDLLIIRLPNMLFGVRLRYFDFGKIDFPFAEKEFALVKILQ